MLRDIPCKYRDKDIRYVCRYPEVRDGRDIILRDSCDTCNCYIEKEKEELVVESPLERRIRIICRE